MSKVNLEQAENLPSREKIQCRLKGRGILRKDYHGKELWKTMERIIQRGVNKPWNITLEACKKVIPEEDHKFIGTCIYTLKRVKGELWLVNNSGAFLKQHGEWPGYRKWKHRHSFYYIDEQQFLRKYR